MSEASDRSSHRRYFTDENIRRSVVEAIRVFGRSVTESRTVSPGASDMVLERVAAQNGWVLVTHDRDFKYSASKKTLRNLRRSAPTVQLLPDPDCDKWIVTAIPIIEDQLAWAEKNALPIRVIRIKAGVVNVEIGF